MTDPVRALTLGNRPATTGFDLDRFGANHDAAQQRLRTAGDQSAQDFGAVGAALDASRKTTQRAKVFYNPSTKKFFANGQELPEDYRVLKQVAETADLPEMDQPAGAIPVPEGGLAKMLSELESESDWGSFGPAFAEGVGYVGSAVGNMVGADESWNPFDGMSERHRASQPLAEQKSYEEGGLGSMAGFQTSLAQGLGSAAGPIGAGIAAGLLAPEAAAAGAATAAGLAMGMAQGGGSQGDDARRSLVTAISATSDDELRAGSQFYDDLRDQGASEAEAKQQLTERGVRAATMVGGVLSVPEVLLARGLLGNLARKVGLGKVVGNATGLGGRFTNPQLTGYKSALNPVIRGTTYGTLEGLQEMGETMGSQSAAGAATGAMSANPLDYANSGDFTGAAPVGFLLGALGGGGKTSAQRDPETDPNPVVDSDIGQAAAGISTPMQQAQASGVAAAAAPARGPTSQMSDRPPNLATQLAGFQGAGVVQNSQMQGQSTPMWVGGIGALPTGEAMGPTSQMSDRPSFAGVLPAGIAAANQPARGPTNAIDAPRLRNAPPEPAADQDPYEFAMDQLVYITGADRARLEPALPMLWQYALELEQDPKRAHEGQYLLRLLSMAGAPAQQSLGSLPQGPEPTPPAAPGPQGSLFTPEGAAVRTPPTPPAPPAPPSDGSYDFSPSGEQFGAPVVGRDLRTPLDLQPIDGLQFPSAAPPPAPPATGKLKLVPKKDYSKKGHAAKTSTSEAPTTPEPAADIAAQVATLTDPKSTKTAVLVPVGSEVALASIKLPRGVKAYPRPGVGTLLTRNDAVGKLFKTKKTITEKDKANWLGYPQAKDDAIAAGGEVVLQAKTPEGADAASAIASPEAVPATAEALQVQAPEAAVTVSTPEAAQADRAARVAAESKPTRAKALKDKNAAKGTSREQANAQTAAAIERMRADGRNESADTLQGLMDAPTKVGAMFAAKAEPAPKAETKGEAVKRKAKEKKEAPAPKPEKKSPEKSEASPDVAPKPRAPRMVELPVDDRNPIKLANESVEVQATRDMQAAADKHFRYNKNEMSKQDALAVYTAALKQRADALTAKVTAARDALRTRLETEAPAVLQRFDEKATKAKSESGKKDTGKKPSDLLNEALIASEQAQLRTLLERQIKAEAQRIKRGTWTNADSVVAKVLNAVGMKQGVGITQSTQKMIRTMAASQEQLASDLDTLVPLLSTLTLGKEIVRGADVIQAVAETPDKLSTFGIDDRSDVSAASAQTSAPGSSAARQSPLSVEPGNQELPRVTYYKGVPKAVAEALDGLVKLLDKFTKDGDSVLLGSTFARVQLMTLDQARALYGDSVNLTGANRGAFFIRDGFPVIAVDFANLPVPAAMETVAHELGHLFKRLAFDRLSSKNKKSVADAFSRWLEVNEKVSPKAARLARAPSIIREFLEAKSPESFLGETAYSLSFDEWFADMTARWVATSSKPKTIVESLVAEIAEFMRKVWAALTGAEILPDATFAEFMDGWVASSKLRAMAAPVQDMDVADASSVPTVDAVVGDTRAAISMKRSAENFVGEKLDTLSDVVAGGLKAIRGESPGTGKVKEGLSKLLLMLSTRRDIVQRFKDRSWGGLVKAITDIDFEQAQVANKELEKISASVGHALALSWKGKKLLFAVMKHATTNNLHPDVEFTDKKNKHLASPEVKVTTANQSAHDQVRALYLALNAETGGNNGEDGKGGKGFVEGEGAKAYKSLRDAMALLHRKSYVQQLVNLRALRKGPKPAISAKAYAEQRANFARAYSRRIRGPYFPLMRFGDWIVRAWAPPESVYANELTKEGFKTRGAADKEAAIVKAQNPHAVVEIDTVPADEGGGFIVRVYHRAVYFFDTQAAAKAATPAILAEIKAAWDKSPVAFDEANAAFEDGMIANPIAKLSYYEQRLGKLPSGFLHEVNQLLESKTISQSAHDELVRMHLESLDEYSYRKALLPRQNILGASEDMLRAYAIRGAGAAQAFAASKFAQKATKAWRKLEDAADAGDADPEIRPVLDAINQSRQLARQRVQRTTWNAFGNVLSDLTTFMSLSFSPAYAATNALQPAMTTVPVLGAVSVNDKGDALGVVKAAKYVQDAYKSAPRFFLAERGVQDLIAEFKQLTGKESKEGEFAKDATAIIVDKFGKTPEEKAMLKTLLERGTLDFAFLNSLHDAMRAGKVGEVWGSVLRAGMAFPQQIEAMNRVVTALASFRVAQNELGMKAKAGASQAEIDAANAEATTFADDMVARTQLDYSRVNRPATFNMSAGFLLQFKMYMQGMYSLFAFAGSKALAGKTVAERREGRRVIGYILMTHASAGGIAGLGPVALAAKVAVGIMAFAFGDDDDKWLSNKALLDQMAVDLASEALGEQAGDKVAQAFLRGLPTLIGQDISDRLGIPDITDTRFMNLREDDTGGQVANKLLLYGMGAPWATITRIADGMGYAADGDMKQATKALPSFLRGPARAAYASTDGITDKDGDVFKPRADLSAIDLATMVLGNYDADTQRQYAARSERYKVTADIMAERKSLLRRYREADAEGRKAMAEDFAEFNRSVPKLFAISRATTLESVEAGEKRNAGQLNKMEQAAKELVDGK